MALSVWNPLLLAILLWMNIGRAAALTESEICYVLDGLLFLYGIILTVLYCQIKIGNKNKEKRSHKVEEGVYMGLTPRTEDTYETISRKK